MPQVAVATRMLVGGLILAALCAGGCQSPPKQRPLDFDPEILRPRRPPPVQDPLTLLVNGTPPVYYRFPNGGHIRIVDGTAAIPLYSGVAEPQTFIVIDAREGIHVGATKVVPGPLPADHRYEIWWDARTGRPAPPP